MEHDVAAKKIADFGEQWLSFRGNPGLRLCQTARAYFRPAPYSRDELVGARIADAGSGTGRIVNMLLDAQAKHVYAVEPSAAMAVLRENVAARAEQVTCVEGVGERLPAGLDLDFVVSIGVLHQLPEPAAVVRAAFAAAGGTAAGLALWQGGQRNRICDLPCA